MVGVVGACALIAPAGAQAAKLTFGLTAEPGKDFILYKADPGERNRIKVKLGAGSVTISDRGARRLVVSRKDFNPSCRKVRGQLRVVCSKVAPGGFVQVVAGDINDLVRFSPRADTPAPAPSDPLRLGEVFADFDSNYSSVSTIIDGGPGNDAITGSQFRDRILPGRGRDKVDARNGDDLVQPTVDGSRDAIAGGGGVDDLISAAGGPVTVDLQAGVAKSAGDRDRIAGIERVHGTRFDDTLLGSSGPDALYGLGGNDVIDGRGGNDLLAGDYSFERAGASSAPTGNRISGGEGDDVIDARVVAPAGTSLVDCGPGVDRYAGGVDANVGSSCEFAAFRNSSDATSPIPLGPLYDVREPIAPLSRAADGAPTYRVACPTAAQLDAYAGVGVCEGAIFLERPPVFGSSGPAEQLGRGDFFIATGQAGDVPVALTAAGQNALASGAAVAVHVAGNGPPRPEQPSFYYGWQQQPLGG